MALCFCAPSFAQTKEVVIPFEDLKVFDEFPDYVYAMPHAVYVKWVELQNAGAYRKAERMADAWRERNPFRETYIQDSKYTAKVQQSQNESFSPTSATMAGKQDTQYEGRNAQRAFKESGYGGGPVLVLNPYVDRPAKVIINDDGVAYVADPDKTIKNVTDALKMLAKFNSQ
jgi:hypothetical protein